MRQSCPNNGPCEHGKAWEWNCFYTDTYLDVGLLMSVNYNSVTLDYILFNKMFYQCNIIVLHAMNVVWSEHQRRDTDIYWPQLALKSLSHVNIPRGSFVANDRCHGLMQSLHYTCIHLPKMRTEVAPWLQRDSLTSNSPDIRVTFRAYKYRVGLGQKVSLLIFAITLSTASRFL